LWLPSDHQLWSSFRYLEVARYRPHFEAVIREQVNHVPLILEVDEVEAWREQRGNLGLYTSVFRYDDKAVETARRLKRYEFMISFAPIPVEGGTGSPINPLAIF